MLCGIGGRTIEEAQQRLSFSEFRRWQQYRRLRGTLHLGRRVDRSSAQLAAIYANAHSQKKYKLADFMPYEGESQTLLTLEEMRKWT